MTNTIEQDFEDVVTGIECLTVAHDHHRDEAEAALSRIHAEVERLRETLRETEAADLAIGQGWIQRAQAAEAALDDIERLDIARIRVAAWEQAQYPDAEGARALWENERDALRPRGRQMGDGFCGHSTTIGSYSGELVVECGQRKGHAGNHEAMMSWECAFPDCNQAHPEGETP